MHLIEFQLLLLIIVSNGAPILGKAVLKKRWTYPLDGGRSFTDGRPLLGRSKTWRGVLLAITGAAVMAWLVGLPVEVGIAIGCFVVLGDTLSSFIKRRFGLPASSMALGLDQIPEALLPLVAFKTYFNLTWFAIMETVTGFLILELLLSYILFKLKVRDRPY
jgi:CDP-2,3-bis-(O-geranylgeranyl)-sn-glycerol synthase